MVNIVFDGSMTDPASAPLNGNVINIGPPFFGGLNGATQGYVIRHEGGHLAGLDDLPLPPGALGGRAGRAYGSVAADWLGANDPSKAEINNENYQCVVLGDTCGL